MKDKILRSLTAGAVLAVVASLAIWSTGVVGKQQDKGKPKKLREIAAERDVEVPVATGESDSEYTDLESLSRAAYAIVVGRITEEQPKFDGDDYIVTTYSVDIQRVIKDAHTTTSAPAGYPEPDPITTPLKVVRSGGVVQYQGHRVSAKLRGSELLKPQQDYVLFLYWSPAFNSYKLLGGSSGAFLIRPNQKGVRPLGFASGMLKYEGTDPESFLQAVIVRRR
jgi:hypothetical protein